jgi:hypothetical protein
MTSLSVSTTSQEMIGRIRHRACDASLQLLGCNRALWTNDEIDTICHLVADEFLATTGMPWYGAFNVAWRQLTWLRSYEIDRSAPCPF